MRFPKSMSAETSNIILGVIPHYYEGQEGQRQQQSTTNAIRNRPMFGGCP